MLRPMAIDYQSIADAISTAISGNPNVRQVTVGGRTVSWNDPSQAIDLVAFFEAKAARAAGTRPRAAQINLGGF